MHAALLAFSLPLGIQAGATAMWQLKQTEAAPMLVVGRVLRIAEGKRIPDKSPSQTYEIWSRIAVVEVLREFPDAGKNPVIRVRFLQLIPGHSVVVSGPTFPYFETGRVSVLPLQNNLNSASEVWHLIEDSGMGIIVPSRADLALTISAPDTRRSFLLRELGNVLCNGSSQELTELSHSLEDQFEDLRGDLMPMLEASVGNDRQRWAEIVTSLLAAQGSPRLGVADLKSGEPPSNRTRTGILLAQAALRKLRPSPETDSLLIRTWITNASWNLWGTAGSLTEYAKNPVTTQTIRQALRDERPGAWRLAVSLARAGNAALLPEALKQALQTVDRPDADYNSLVGSAALILERGSDDQVQQVADLFHRYESTNEKFYSSL